VLTPDRLLNLRGVAASNEHLGDDESLLNQGDSGSLCDGSNPCEAANQNSLNIRIFCVTTFHAKKRVDFIPATSLPPQCIAYGLPANPAISHQSPRQKQFAVLCAGEGFCMWCKCHYQPQAFVMTSLTNSLQFGHVGRFEGLRQDKKEAFSRGLGVSDI
jgi:hypothetical protein